MLSDFIMSDITLSVVVPVYKTSKTLCRCLDSVFAQLDKGQDNVEVVAVNDASPDNCGEILRDYQRNHESLRIITHERNLGEAGAHNTGIRESRGRYYTFLDSDDTLSPNAVSRLVGIINRYEPDLIHYAYVRVDEEGKYLSRSNIAYEGIVDVYNISKVEAKSLYFDTAFGIMTAGGVYRRGVADGLTMSPRFPISGERYYGWQFFAKCKRIYLTNDILYNYYQYGNSISRVFSEKAVKGLLSLNILFWNEFHAHVGYKRFGKYVFRRLFPAIIGWDYELVFESEPEKKKLAGLYFQSLAEYLQSMIAPKELWLDWFYLWFAAKIRSGTMIRLYRIKVRAMRKCKRIMKKIICKK